MILEASPASESSSRKFLGDRRRRLAWLWLGLASLLFAGYGSLVPFHFHTEGLSQAWTQLVSTKGDVLTGSRVDWGVNVLLFVPAGFCLLAAATRANPTVVRRIIAATAVALICLLASLVIEFAQSWFPPRVPSLADVHAQFWGAVSGMAGWWLFGSHFNHALEQFASGRGPRSRLELVLLAYLAGFLIFSLAPLDLTLQPHDLLQKYRDGSILLVPFSYKYTSDWALAYDLLSDVILFIPIGVWASIGFTRGGSGPVREIGASMLLAGSVVLGIELLQLLIASRVADTTDLLTGGLGATIGIVGYRYVRRHPSATDVSATGRQVLLSVAAAVYSGFILAMYWTPFNFELANKELIHNRWADFFGVPLSQALEGSYLAAFNGFMQKFVLFAPLGGMIAVFASGMPPLRRFFASVALLSFAAGFAMLLELGQLFLPSRSASFDDVMISVIGLVSGYAITKALSRRSQSTERSAISR